MFAQHKLASYLEASKQLRELLLVILCIQLFDSFKIIELLGHC